MPQSGTSVFAPVAVSTGEPTGTQQGNVIAGLRTRLVTTQGELASRNANLSDIRQKAAGEGALYRLAKNDVIATPTPAPDKIAAAQAALDRFAGQTAALDGEVKIFARGAADLSRMMTEAALVRDGSEEDQRQINRLRGEIAQTTNQVDRLVNDLSTESALQNAYLAKERASLANLGGASTNPGTGVTTTSLSQALPAPASLLAQPAFVTIKFDRDNVSYRGALAQAVQTARRRNPDTSFDVVGISNPRGSAAEALAKAQEVAQALATLGVAPAKVSMLAGTSPVARSAEVRIYAH